MSDDDSIVTRATPPLEVGDYHLLVDTCAEGIKALRAKAEALDKMWRAMFQAERTPATKAPSVGLIGDVQLTSDEVRTLSITASDRLRRAEAVFKLVDYRVLR